ncbi:MAG: tRNA preQ1(34) S-adenosylmethionine ribosyltransferase-isomerase QueA [Turicibacter sp.]|nr:tRNA preQ1(34) S-adenosylmethionine ribosyltransferase-isomerase QueA [Turicibacter sp.]
MKVADFDFHLPEELIAQTPLKKRDASRLMVVDVARQNITHEVFSNIASYFNAGDTLILNDTKVMPARLIGVKPETNASIEVLLLKQEEGDRWETLVKPARRIKEGTVVEFGDGRLKATCVRVADEGIRSFEFSYEGIFYEVLDSLGEMPLPPYITEKLADRDRYQTVYGKEIGSAAASTAGLHFTEELLDAIRSKGVNIAFMTLHIGLGTFRPVKVDDILDHEMHSEYYQVSEETADLLNQTRENGGRIITCGTSATRTLETIVHANGKFVASVGWTDIFIYPGFEFKAIDGMITNFHLPKSTLIMMISALAGKEFIMDAYQKAIAEKYRFFSFGDAMFIRLK